MINPNRMRAIALLTVLILILTSLVGCGDGKDSPADKSDNNMGRYVEETLEMDAGFACVLDSFHDGDSLVFYARESRYDGRVTRNVYKDGQLVTVYSDLLNELAANTGLIWNISESPNGTLMVLHYDEAYNFTLSRVAEGMITRIHIPGWEYNLYSSEITFPNKVIALDDSFLILFLDNCIIQYDYDGVILHEYAVRTGPTGLAVHDGTLTTLNDYCNELLSFDLVTGLQTLALPMDRVITSDDETVDLHGYSCSGDLFLSYDETGLILAFADGVFLFDGEGFVKALDGGLTSLVMPTVEINGIVRIGDEFYAFLDNMSESQLVRYVYRSDIPKTPSITLDIFSLYDNLTMRQAIGEFQRINPDVKVDMRIGVDGSSGATVEDVVRALNTEILAGKGPDLVVLDGLPIISYIEKGVLKDISTLADKLVADNMLMKNMRDTYVGINGGVYGVPTRFTVPVMIGDTTALAGITSLSELASLVTERQSENNMFLFPPHNLYFDMYTLQSSNMLMNYYDVSARHFVNTNGSINENALASYFENMCLVEQALKEYTPATAYELMFTRSLSRTSSGMGAEYIDMSIEYMADGKTDVSLMTLAGPQSLRFVTQTLYYTDAVMVPMFDGGAYLPVGGIGVISTGSKQEIAERFVELLLYGTVQNQLLGDGFPVNGRSLEYVVYELIKYWMEYVGTTELLDMGFIQLASNLNEPVFVDNVIKTAVESQISALQAGLLTPQEAAQKVVNETRLYLLE